MNNIEILITGLVIAFIAGLILVIILANKRAQKHKKETAAMLGFSAVQEPGEDLYKRIEWLFSGPGRTNFEIKNLYHKNFLDGEIYLFDLQETSGEDNSNLADGGILLISDYLNLPKFSLAPKLLMSGKLAEMANWVMQWMLTKSGQRVDFSDHPAFEERYMAVAEDPNALRGFLDSYLLEQLTKTEPFALNAGGNALAIDLPAHIRQDNKIGDEDRIRQSINTALRCYSLFSSGSNTAKTTEHQIGIRPAANHCPTCGAPIPLDQRRNLNYRCEYCSNTIRSKKK